MKKLFAPFAGACAAPKDPAGIHGKSTRVYVLVQLRARKRSSVAVRVFCCETCLEAGFRPLQARPPVGDARTTVGWLLPPIGKKVIPIRPGIVPRLRRTVALIWSEMPAAIGTPAFPSGEAG